MQRIWFQWALSVVFLSCCTAQAQETTLPDPWKPFQFLIGKWSGIGSGKPGEAITGSTSFTFDLDKRIIIRRNIAEYPPKAGEKLNVVHEDLMIIYPASTDSKFHADYFDNEGHVINYTVSISVNPAALVLESPGNKEGVRFRLVYKLGLNGTMTTDFLIAPPGGQFKTYVKGILKKDS